MMKYNIRIPKMIFFLLMGCLSKLVWANTQLTEDASEQVFSNLTNYQVDTPTMVSAGLPKRIHFEAFKEKGVRNVVDLIPGDRHDEMLLMQELGLDYHNIAVEWENPTLANFDAYVQAMQTANANGGTTLTHCKLNWRGAVFTYLYRITQLDEDEETAKLHMLAIWSPNDRWQAFIDEVKAKYASSSKRY
jgi:protein tyrosine phosphatase (PTP) superfamily phosphohydrolase (DUF442 family)